MYTVPPLIYIDDDVERAYSSHSIPFQTAMFYEQTRIPKYLTPSAFSFYHPPVSFALGGSYHMSGLVVR